MPDGEPGAVVREKAVSFLSSQITCVHLSMSMHDCWLCYLWLNRPTTFFFFFSLKLMRVHLHFSQELCCLTPPSLCLPFILCPYFLFPCLTLLNPPLFTLKFTHLFWQAHTHTHANTLPLFFPSSSAHQYSWRLPPFLFSCICLGFSRLPQKQGRAKIKHVLCAEI